MEKNITMESREKSVEQNKMDTEKHYESLKRTIDGWPSWKKEIHQKLIRLTT